MRRITNLNKVNITKNGIQDPIRFGRYLEGSGRKVAEASDE
jgi:hypothetical protein